MPDPAQRRVLCPGCQTVLALPLAMAAKKLACPKCKAIVDPATAVDAPSPSAVDPKPTVSPEPNSGPKPASDVVPGKLDLGLPEPIGAPGASPTPLSSSTSQKAKSGDVHVPVVCFVCGTRYYALSKNIGGQAKCPDCFTMNEVRAPREKPKQSLGPGLTPMSDSGTEFGLTKPEATPAYRPMFRDTPKPESGVGPGQGNRPAADDGPLDLSLPDLPGQPLTSGPPQFRASDRDNNPAAPAAVSPAAPAQSAQPKQRVELVDPMVDSVARRRELEAKKPAPPKSPDQDEDDDDFRLSEPVERTGFSEKLAKEIVDEAKRSTPPPRPASPSSPSSRPPGPIIFGTVPVPPAAPSASAPASSSAAPAPMADTKRWRVEEPAPASSPTPVRSSGQNDDPLDLESMAQALPSASRATVTAPMPPAQQQPAQSLSSQPHSSQAPPSAPLDDDPSRGGISLRRGMTVEDLAQKYEVEEPDDFDPYKYKFELPKSNWLLLQPKVMVRWFICAALVGAVFAMGDYGIQPASEEVEIGSVEPVMRTIVAILSLVCSLIAFGYLANCCYFLAEISANDHKTVDEWPAANVPEAAMNAFFIFAGIFWSGTGMALLSLLVGVATGIGWLSAVLSLLVWPSVFVLFPPVYVSMLEGGGVSSPFSMNVWLAIRRRPGPWIGHYIATIGYFIAMALAVGLFMFYGFSLTYLFAGLVVSGAWLLYFEQIGKLARIVNGTVMEIAAEEARKEAAE